MRRIFLPILVLGLSGVVACSAPAPILPTPAGPVLPMSWKKWQTLEREDRALVRPVEGRPTWICALPPHQGLLALGYSMPWVYPGDTLLHACKRGVDHLTRTVLSKVRTESAVLTWQYWEHGWFDKEVEVPEGQDRLVAGSARVVDVWLEPGTAAGWCLVSLPGGPQPGGPSPSLEVSEGSPCDVRPSWLDAPPSGKGEIYAVGTSGAWAEEWRGIENAEEDALGELSRVLASKAEGALLKLTRGGADEIHQIRKLVSQAVLVGAQVVAWWRDPTDGSWFTLARLPLTPLKVSLVTEVSALTEDKGSSDDVPLLKRAEEHHRHMEEVLDAMDW